MFGFLFLEKGIEIGCEIVIVHIRVPDILTNGSILVIESGITIVELLIGVVWLEIGGRCLIIH